jgi:carbonic anhydrase/acetyltransferase-like protein (isoleucine patch superfamily)
VVYGQARVSGQAKVYDQAVVYEQAVVRGQAKVCGQAVVCGQANVVNGVWRRSPLQIGGTLHWVSESAPGVLRIGCSEHTVSEWMEQGESIGREHDYTDAEIAEYRLYVELFAALEQLREESDEHN